MNDYAGHTAEALRALCAGATPGPWVSFADEPGALYTVASVGGGPDAAIEEICREPEGDERIADMAFIAAARLALPATLDRVAALEAENARLRDDAQRANNLADMQTEIVRAARRVAEAVLMTEEERALRALRELIQAETRQVL